LIYRNIWQNGISIFQEYLSFLPFQVASFTKSNCCDFSGKDKCPQFTWP